MSGQASGLSWEEDTMNTGAMVIDEPALMDRLEGDRQLLKELADLYFEDEPVLLEQIARALQAGDAELLRRTSHTLKGSVSNFCAPLAQAAAYCLECAGRDGTLEQAPELLDQLRTVLSRVRTDLRSLTRDIE
jgi:two-component system, sensor histidine kinase and response regulator